MASRVLRRCLLVAVLVAALACGLSAQAAPSGADAFGWWGWLGAWWASLWQGQPSPRDLPGLASLPDKEGGMMDPHGQPTPNPTPPDRTDEGPGMDPHG